MGQTLDILPPTLLKNINGQIVAVNTVDELNGSSKILLYYAGLRCPYCVNFTPTLNDFIKVTNREYNTNIEGSQCYKDLRGFKVILVSKDYDQEKFLNYFKGLNDVLAVKFEQVDQVLRFYNPSTIPKLVLVDIKTQKIQSENVREKLVKLEDESKILDMEKHKRLGINPDLVHDFLENCKIFQE